MTVDDFPIGSKVTASYRKEHTGIVLAQNNLEAWRGTLAFPRDELLNQEAVDRHVEWCRNDIFGFDKVPVLWSFGRIYWESPDNLILIAS